jgi:hypothetical protein
MVPRFQFFISLIVYRLLKVEKVFNIFCYFFIVGISKVIPANGSTPISANGK